ncbi:MAG: NUDIX domain-containing protein [Bacteroidales bacterium]|nr:NUDIX domain-containing protein [Bacteroidales bacterium]MDY6002557.1 NUDIX domain-containing protein [Candidatus Cryptobacteroides sp.]
MGKNFTYVPGAEFPYQYRYEHMAVTTDCVIFTYEDRKLKVLLVRRGGEPYKGFWAFPGGFLQLNETAKDGALRELREETGLEAAAIGELGVFSDPDRDPRERVITIAYYALVKPSEVIGGDDADEAVWFPVDNLPELAFDHNKIFEAAMERLRRDIHFEPIGFDLLDDTFTIPDLRCLYEAILGVKFDRRNFQRKIMASGILEEADAPESDEAAMLYEAAPTPMMMADMDFCDAMSVPKMEECCLNTDMAEPELPHVRKGRPGRVASLFRLNRAKYDEMKEDGGKTEF